MPIVPVSKPGGKEQSPHSLSEAIDNFSAGLWARGLVEQARRNGGTVTIKIPSLGVEFTLTEAEAAAPLNHSPKS